jgi:homoserine kinase
MEDRLHQPYRAAIFPALPALIEAALSAGAAGAALSGAGSTVIALCEGDPAAVVAALATGAATLGVSGRPVTARIDQSGAAVLPS